MSACAGEFHSRIPLLCAACDFWAMSDRQLLVFSSLQGNQPTMEDAHGAEDWNQSTLTSRPPPLVYVIIYSTVRLCTTKCFGHVAEGTYSTDRIFLC